MKSAQMSVPYTPVDLEKLMNNLDKESFYMYRFKTEMCPNISMKHNYKDCLYFHNPKDYRRKPDFLRYYPDNCTNGANCPNNPECDMSHSLFENLYHPLKYKVNSCDKIVQDYENSVLYCIRGDRCAFYHDENDRRKIASNGCKLNADQDDNKSVKSSISSQGLSPEKEQTRFTPFAPHEDISSDLNVYQRKHARSDYMAHPMPSLSQPVAVGLSQPQRPDPRLQRQSYVYPQGHMMPVQQPYRMPSPPYNIHPYNLSPPKQRSYNEFDDQEQLQAVDSNKGVVYNNQLFEGGTIPSRQTSYSESSAHMLNRQYARNKPVLNYTPIQDRNMQGQTVKFNPNSPTRFESHGVSSTTPSSEIPSKKRGSKNESDTLKYLFDGGLGYERRADSLKSPVPPGLSSKYKMEEESSHPKSQTDFSENYHEKLESKFVLMTQRKITEDKEKEDSSQSGASESEKDADEAEMKSKASKM